jgi:hypothetical protein
VRATARPRAAGRTYIRFTSASPSANATPPQPTAAPSRRARKNITPGWKIRSALSPWRCSGAYSPLNSASSSPISIRASSVAV